uniref:LigA n=1 Tax=Parastrongyloides trichosuri TaxID=131310 RepID=A0A0N4Z5F8_PARTI
MQVSGGSQSFNAVNQMRILGRWMRSRHAGLRRLSEFQRGQHPAPAGPVDEDDHHPQPVQRRQGLHGVRRQRPHEALQLLRPHRRRDGGAGALHRPDPRPRRSPRTRPVVGRHGLEQPRAPRPDFRHHEASDRPPAAEHGRHASDPGAHPGRHASLRRLAEFQRGQHPAPAGSLDADDHHPQPVERGQGLHGVRRRRPHEAVQLLRPHRRCDGGTGALHRPDPRPCRSVGGPLFRAKGVRHANRCGQRPVRHRDKARQSMRPTTCPPSRQGLHSVRPCRHAGLRRLAEFQRGQHPAPARPLDADDHHPQPVQRRQGLPGVRRRRPHEAVQLLRSHRRCDGGTGALHRLDAVARRAGLQPSGLRLGLVARRPIGWRCGMVRLHAAVRRASGLVRHGRSLAPRASWNGPASWTEAGGRGCGRSGGLGDGPRPDPRLAKSSHRAGCCCDPDAARRSDRSGRRHRPRRFGGAAPLPHDDRRASVGSKLPDFTARRRRGPGPVPSASGGPTARLHGDRVPRRRLAGRLLSSRRLRFRRRSRRSAPARRRRGAARLDRFQWLSCGLWRSPSRPGAAFHLRRLSGRCHGAFSEWIGRGRPLSRGDLRAGIAAGDRRAAVLEPAARPTGGPGGDARCERGGRRHSRFRPLYPSRNQRDPESDRLPRGAGGLCSADGVEVPTMDSRCPDRRKRGRLRIDLTLGAPVAGA